MTFVLSVIAIGVGAVVGMVASPNNPQSMYENMMVGACLGFFYTWGIYFIIRLVVVIVRYIVKGFKSEG